MLIRLRAWWWIAAGITTLIITMRTAYITRARTGITTGTRFITATMFHEARLSACADRSSGAVAMVMAACQREARLGTASRALIEEPRAAERVKAQALVRAADTAGAVATPDSSANFAG
jgi:hypothetical protein